MGQTVIESFVPSAVVPWSHSSEYKGVPAGLNLHASGVVTVQSGAVFLPGAVIPEVPAGFCNPMIAFPPFQPEHKGFDST